MKALYCRLIARSSLPIALLTSTLASAAGAQSQVEEPPQQSAPSHEKHVAVLWYRSTEGCPDGSTFIARLGDRAEAVRLARAGDRVDFVVNLAQTPEGARGQLERETGKGTVAIREVTDPNCERVADVLALNLALAFDPEAHASGASENQSLIPPDGPSAADPADNQPALAKPTGTKPSGKSPPPSDETSSRNTPEDDAPTPPSRHEPSPLQVRVGLRGGILSGVARGLMGRAAAFIEVGDLFESVLPHLTLGAEAVGAWGASNTESGVIGQTIWAGRLVLCPVALGDRPISLAPCVAGEVGQIRAAGPISDSALWGALGAHARGRWVVTGPFALEAEAGILVPLKKYSIDAGVSTLYQSSPVGVNASLGASFDF